MVLEFYTNKFASSLVLTFDFYKLNLVGLNVICFYFIIKLFLLYEKLKIL